MKLSALLFSVRWLAELHVTKDILHHPDSEGRSAFCHDPVVIATRAPRLHNGKAHPIVAIVLHHSHVTSTIIKTTIEKDLFYSPEHE
jgi:hypothetical protein